LSQPLAQLLFSVPPAGWRTRQVVVFDWQNGPRQGFCALEFPACAFYFEVLAERWSGSRYDDRLFRIHQLEWSAVERAARVFGHATPPTAPVWAPGVVPVDDDERRRIEAELAAIVAERVETRLLCRTGDMVSFTEVWLDTCSTPEPGADRRETDAA